MPASKVMIVEDEGLIAHDIAGELSRNGFEVTAICASGEEALSSIEAACPNLVLLDIKLRGKIDGIEVALRIHSQYRVPVIFLTSHADKETFSRAMQANPFTYLLKPFRRATLCGAIESAITKHRNDATVRMPET